MSEDRHELALGMILQLVVVLNEDMTKSLERDGLTNSRAPVVWFLGQNGPMTQKELATAVGVSARNITGLVDALEATGFVARGPHPTDRRATLVSLTALGDKTARAMDRDKAELAELLFTGIPERKLDAFVDVLGEVLGRINRELERLKEAG
ncbi:MarR family winged helix-turn-helix transcriptional regulator [Allorhizocola rhizosphaerae]|uniref:MarR family winged helix-turn-helix transcriptional regulator n=1 Tax=Allorhizocola rhizosphaerae TaxID=1872709 RepID=UPI000E3E2BE2|nr:MarR family transcriptional regulator [Allorhizocola rhizosphaerae]